MITKKDLYTKEELLWQEIEDLLDEIGVNEFYVPETLPEEDALELFIKVMDRFGPNEVIKLLGRLV